MMVYVQRDSQGKVVGVYANKQDGYAEEELKDTDKEVIDFKERSKPKLSGD